MTMTTDRIDPLIHETPPPPKVGGSTNGGRQVRAPLDTSSKETLKWARWVHVYTSMIAFLLILFFGITGITLNHPTWTFGDGLTTSTLNGTLPMTPVLADGTPDYLSISEYARSELGVHGSVDSFETLDGVIGISYRNPGYSAELFVQAASGSYDLTVEQAGWVAAMNDLHKGRDTGNGWRWIIDLSAGFLVLVSLSGLLMQFFLRRRRRSAFISVGVGAAISLLVVMWVLR